MPHRRRAFRQEEQHVYLPAGVHLLPYVRKSDGAHAVVITNEHGEAEAGPFYVEQGKDLVAECARFMEVIETTLARSIELDGTPNTDKTPQYPSERAGSAFIVHQEPRPRRCD